MLSYKKIKKFIMAISILASVGCGACSSHLKSESSDAEDYPWKTWEDCSQNVGDHVCDFTLSDQNGNLVSLYDFYGDTIVLDLSAMWCGPCNYAASEAQDVAGEHANDDFVYITVLVENSVGADPSQEDCKDWADTYGIQEPVLAGDRSLLDHSGQNGWPLNGWPTFYFIDDEMVLNTSLQGFSSSHIDALIDDTMNN